MLNTLSRMLLHVRQHNLPRLRDVVAKRTVYAVTLSAASAGDPLAFLSLCDSRTEERICYASLDTRTGRVRCW